MNARTRQLAAAIVVLALTVGGFFGARALGQRDARRDSQHRAELAATEVRDRVEQAANLTDGVRRFLAGPVGPGVSAEQFIDVGTRWLGPVGVPASAWIEQVSGSERASYERRTGLGIVALTRSGGVAPVGARRTYLPATLATRVPPMTTAGLDLESMPGVADAVARPQTDYRASATPLVTLMDGTQGVFLVQAAQRLERGGLVEPGFVVLFMPASWLLSAAADTDGSTANLALAVGGASTGSPGSGATARSTFTVAGEPFVVGVPRVAVHGASAVLPWIILGAGLVLAALAGALGVDAARRAKAKADVDRLFMLSPDLIVVVGFDGYFKRVNPAFETRLGYTEQEALARPLYEFVHPDDREQTEVEMRRLSEGRTLVSFENRYVAKDGSRRLIDWTATPVLNEGVIYGVGRDVTERRRAERELIAAEERHRTLAQAQTALRHVATLVARRASPREVFTATAVEANRLLGSDSAALARYEPDGTATVLAIDGVSEDEIPVGLRIPLDGESAMATVVRTGRTAWAESFDDASGSVAEIARRLSVRSSVGAPIVVEGRLWGVIVVTSRGLPLPTEIEGRLADFTELVATGIADAESRAALARLADEQVALRRVATLVAEGVAPAEVFAAVADEVGRLLDAEAAVIARLEPDGTVTIVAAGGATNDAFALGRRVNLEPGTVIATVLRTGRSAQADESSGIARRSGTYTSVGVPIIVEGALWGAIATAAERDRFPGGTEQRMAEFTELAATAIANAEGRAELNASRARIVATADATRRRIERDLHDGTQQRLVSLALELRAAQAAVPRELDEHRATLARTVEGLTSVLDDLREFARGIHPGILAEGGLGPALKTLAHRSVIPVELDVRAEMPLPEGVEVAAYYIVSESLTNVAKYAHASVVHVAVEARDHVLRVSVRDDGRGGADAARGSGLVGLKDRAEAMGGTMSLQSPPGAGTSLVVELPIDDPTGGVTTRGSGRPAAAARLAERR
ncbi:MAG TPA: GAF domain-containing protein [Gaiellaceae bacterium]|nr:GAF domain-containing protein [Gaiellaceae bacterium]